MTMLRASLFVSRYEIGSEIDPRLGPPRAPPLFFEEDLFPVLQAFQPVGPLLCAHVWGLEHDVGQRCAREACRFADFQQAFVTILDVILEHLCVDQLVKDRLPSS